MQLKSKDLRCLNTSHGERLKEIATETTMQYKEEMDQLSQA